MVRYKCDMCGRGIFESNKDNFCIIETFETMEDQTYCIYTGETSSAMFLEVE